MTFIRLCIDARLGDLAPLAVTIASGGNAARREVRPVWPGLLRRLGSAPSASTGRQADQAQAQQHDGAGFGRLERAVRIRFEDEIACLDRPGQTDEVVGGRLQRARQLQQGVEGGSDERSEERRVGKECRL